MYLDAKTAVILYRTYKLVGKLALKIPERKSPYTIDSCTFMFPTKDFRRSDGKLKTDIFKDILLP